jgi:outer membrane protein OmpA-like peptidoglycan-associated protein
MAGLNSPSLSITPIWRDEKIVLVGALDALRLLREGGYEAVDPGKALWDFERGNHRSNWEMRDFASRARLSSFPMSSLSDSKVSDLIKTGIKNRNLIALKRGEQSAGATRRAGPTAGMRRLVRNIEAKTRGRLSQAGRYYKLVADVDLAKIPDRDSYEVVRHDDARQVLEALAAQANTPADLGVLFGKARDQLSPDWRPSSAPEGLILLRRNNARDAVASSNEPAISPSQLRDLMEEEKPIQFFARFVDERGKPVTGFTGKFEHSPDPKCDMPFSSPGFARLGDLKGAKGAWLTLPEKATQDLLDEVKKRWKELRGPSDDAWKKREESLVEVLFKQGKLPELQLEAEKKHTFMLRPPVALGHLRGTYFDTNKCFLLPTAVARLKRLIEIYEQHPESEVLIVGHTDTAGSEAYNLDLSADRADAMKAYLRDDADVWLAWYEEGVAVRKRWGEHEDARMIDALVPDDRFGKGSHVAAYQQWHNGESPDARQPDQTRSQPKGWEELKADGIMGPKTRRQLILDYMNLDGTSLDEDTRVVTYGCGEYFPLETEEGDVDANAPDGEDVAFDRRAEVFFFAKPFGILPPVPGVAEGESSDKATEAAKGDKLYPEWRLRAARHYSIDAEANGFRLRLCDLDLVPYAKRPFAFGLDGYPEIRGTTDKGGFAIIDSPPIGAQGYVEVWPDDGEPENKVHWDVSIGPIISPATPLGASTRLANLGFFAGAPTPDMTDALHAAIRYFQGDTDGLEITGELNGPTCNKLRGLHDCEVPDPAGEKASAPEEQTT